MEKVEKVRVEIAQLVNIGNFENTTYRLGVDIIGFNSESLESVQNAIDFGRKLCEKNTKAYYDKVKEGLTKPVPLEKTVDKGMLELEKKIDNIDNEGQLRALTGKIEEIKDKKMQLVMQRKFNLRLIALKK